MVVQYGKHCLYFTWFSLPLSSSKELYQILRDLARIHDEFDIGIHIASLFPCYLLLSPHLLPP